MVIPIYLLFSMMWYLPVYKWQNKLEKLPWTCYAKTVLQAAVFGLIICVSTQIIIGSVFYSFLGVEGQLKCIVKSFLQAALVEECVKYYIGRKAIEKYNSKSRIHFVLMMGAAGLGYEIIESMLFINNISSAMLRAIFAAHVFWQFWMGYYYFDYVQAKAKGMIKEARKFLLLLYGVPFFLHGLNDYLAFTSEDIYTSLDLLNHLDDFESYVLLNPETEYLVIIATLCIMGTIVLQLSFAIIVMLKCWRLREK